MAGDWIKIEHVTPDKPEVVAMSSALNADQDAVFGKLIRLWIWVDQNSVDGNAMSVTDSWIDRYTYCAGFAKALRQVGWLDGRDSRLSIPNFDRHNGQTAKKRCQTMKRVAKSRNAASVTKTLPDEEKEKMKRGNPQTPLEGNEKCSDEVNEIPAAFDLATGQTTTLESSRAMTIISRLGDPFFRKHWKAVLAKVPKSDFLMGKNDRNWMIDFDWFLKPENFVKIKDGKYDKQAAKSQYKAFNETTGGIL